ncbi:MAG: hypothetical protein ACRDTC_27785 [Pseudonocardiaceae bacterium]
MSPCRATSPSGLRIDALIGVLDPLGPAAAAFEGVPMVVPGEKPSKEVLLGRELDLLLGYGLTAIPWEKVETLGLDQIVDSGQCDSLVDDGPTPDGDASFQDVYDDIELYGRIFDTEDVAARAVADLRARVAVTEERFRLDRPACFRVLFSNSSYNSRLSLPGTVN